MATRLLTFATRNELKRVHDRLVEIRSSAYLFNNLPPDALGQVENACDAMSKAIRAFDEGVNRG